MAEMGAAATVGGVGGRLCLRFDWAADNKSAAKIRFLRTKVIGDRSFTKTRGTSLMTTCKNREETADENDREFNRLIQITNVYLIPQAILAAALSRPCKDFCVTLPGHIVCYANSGMRPSYMIAK